MGNLFKNLLKGARKVGSKGYGALNIPAAERANLGWAALHVGSLAFSLSSLRGMEPQDKLRYGAQEVLLAGVGLAHPGFAGIAMTLGLQLAFESGNIGKGIVQGVRGGLENRTMMNIPFSHSTVNMQMASQSLQYANQRMRSAYGSGNEAAIFAARYMGA